MNSANNRIESIQALRGLAALMVMFSHFTFLLEPYGSLGKQLFQYGVYGVDLFFIISGFVITYASKDKDPGIKSAIKFVKGRAKRILPAYYFILVIFVIFSGGMSLFHYQNKIDNLISALLFMPIYADRAPNFIDVLEIYGVRWSLLYEMYFYIVMALAIITKRRWFTIITWFSITLLFFPLLCTGKINLDTTLSITSNAYVNLITNPIIYEFLVGIVLGASYDKISNLGNKTKLFISLTSLFFIIILIRNYNGLSREDMQVGIIAALVVLCTLIHNNSLQKITPKIMFFLGDISYSLYLVHLGMNYIINRRIEKYTMNFGFTKFIIYCLLSIFFAWLVHKYIEMPFLVKKLERSKKNAMEI